MCFLFVKYIIVYIAILPQIMKQKTVFIDKGKKVCHLYSASSEMLHF